MLKVPLDIDEIAKKPRRRYGMLAMVTSYAHDVTGLRRF